jgi:predicted DsbA family dithiol-disulfide isomerase
VRIDIWSDVICPWCYLGKRRLERALERFDWADEVVVRWRAYRLDPRATDQPGDLRAAIERKYGPGAFDGMTQRLGALGAAEGIDYRFDRALRVSTLDAHRLLAWAWGTSGADGQGRLAEALFRAYFTDGANVADHDTLAALAREAGLDRERAAEALATGSYHQEVADDLAAARERDLTGVPAFVVEDRLLIPGAQDVDTMAMLLARCRERFAPPAAS